MTTFQLSTEGRSGFYNITGQVQQAVSESGIGEGLCLVYCPHTTAALTINENADPDVRRDLLDTLDKLVPWRAGYRHAEGNSAAHVKASLLGSSALIPVEKGSLVLGTWQSVFFCEFDGPRTRTVMVSVVGRERD